MATSYSVTPYSINELSLNAKAIEHAKVDGNASYRNKTNDGHKFSRSISIWGCCNCSEHSGMTTKVVGSCPGCGHARCVYCQTEHIQHRDDRIRENSLPKNTLSLDSLEKRSGLEARPVTSPSQEAPPVTGAITENRKAVDFHSFLTLSSPTSKSSSASPESSPSAQSSPQTIFTERSNDLDTETDEETDETHETDENESDDDRSQMLEHGIDASEDVFDVLEFHLLSILGHDCSLIAEIIPRILGSIRNEFINYEGSFTLVPGYGESGSGNDAHASFRNISGSRDGGVNSSSGGRQLGGTGLWNQRSRGATRTSSRIQRQDRRQGLRRTFACPFHKNNPRKYHPLNDVKYRTCLGPGPAETELRRIKYHLEKQHSPGDGESEINENQMKEIDQLLQLRKKKPLPGEEEWFCIWRILFPGIPQPNSPYDEFELYPGDLDSIINFLNRNYEYDVGQRRIQRDNASYNYFVEALRRAYQCARTGAQHAPSSLVDPMELNDNQMLVSAIPAESSSHYSQLTLARESDPPDPAHVVHEGILFDSTVPDTTNSMMATTGLSNIEARATSESERPRFDSPNLELSSQIVSSDLNQDIETPSNISQDNNQYTTYSDFGFDTSSANESLTPDYPMLDGGSLDMAWHLDSLAPWKASEFTRENISAIGQQQEDNIPTSFEILGLEDQQFDLGYQELDDNTLTAYLQCENESGVINGRSEAFRFN